MTHSSLSDEHSSDMFFSLKICIYKQKRLIIIIELQTLAFSNLSFPEQVKPPHMSQPRF